MQINRLVIFGSFILVLTVMLYQTIFIVEERNKALVLQFGRVIKTVEEPGLNLKVPFIQNTVFYDSRILSLEIASLEITPSDDRRLEVDAFTRYRIKEIIQFRERSAESRLEAILRAETRKVLGSVSSNDILTGDRRGLVANIREQTRIQANQLGLEVIDVRLKRTELPVQNRNATFERMRAERLREATDERARGEEAAQKVRAQADREVVELVSDAKRQAEIIKGRADAERTRIFAEAYGRDIEFFQFYRSLSAYRNTLLENNSTLLLSPDSEFFEYLNNANSN